VDSLSQLENKYLVMFYQSFILCNIKTSMHLIFYQWILKNISFNKKERSTRLNIYIYTHGSYIYIYSCQRTRIVTALEEKKTKKERNLTLTFGIMSLTYFLDE
jgi:hypothetical protein